MAMASSGQGCAAPHEHGQRTSRSGELPLAGIRVVDLTTSYAGPTASMLLADMGADVVKVERPVTGDDARHWGPPFVGPTSAWFLSANRNKRSVCINLSNPGGRAVLSRLIADADVFLESMNPRKLLELRIDPDSLREEKSSLVYCALSGFGLSGPDRDLPGYDLIAQARSGLMSVTGELDGTPQRVSTALSDVTTGIVAAFAVTAALRKKERTGEGTCIDASLLDADLALMAPRIAAYMAGEPEPRPSGATDSVLAIYQSFETADEPLTLAIGNEPIWQRFCASVGLDELGRDPRYDSNAKRHAARGELVDRIAEVMRGQTQAHWLDVLQQAGVPCSPVQYLSEVVADEQVRARGALVQLESGDDGPFHAVESPWRFIDGGKLDHTPPPALGAHTRTVLAEHGYESHQIDELIESEAVWQPPRS